MLALRRLPRAFPRTAGIRGNATLDAPSTSQPNPPPPPAVKAKSTSSQETANSSGVSGTSTETAASTRKGRDWPTRRPSISLERPRDWNRPLAKGVEPAYDLALHYIQQDATALKTELNALRKELQAAESITDGERNEATLASLREKVKILEIQSDINLPNVRWTARNGMADLSKPIYRHLVEKRWREEGDLDLLMERIHQMSVVPDMLPALHPSLDLRVNYLEPPPSSNYLRTRVKRKYQRVEPGIFLRPEQTRRPPHLYTTVFHTDERLYTLLMVDLDVPEPESQSFTTYLHWFQPNVKLSAFSSSPLTRLDSHTPYVPPHPQRGTPYHRYVIMLLPQASPTVPINVPHFAESDRLGFNFRAFSEQYGLDGAKGGGAHMWREVWDETVSHIYEHTLKKAEPKFGKMPKQDPYAEIKRTKKYI